MNQWRSQIESKGRVKTAEGELKDDAFQKLIQAQDDTRAAAQVAVTWGRVGDYGDPKITVTITLTCDQNKATIDAAGFLAYAKACEFVDEIVTDVSRREGQG